MVLAVLLFAVRVLYLMHKICTGFSKTENVRGKRTPCRTLICIGSGGHTTEMLQLMKSLDFSKYYPRHYILANTDVTSKQKIYTLEEKYSEEKDFHLIPIPRSRKVGQSYVTSVFSTLYSVIYSIPVMLKLRPELILCNGPGTCIPICVVAFLMKAVFFCDTRIIFVESFCRTRTFSFSGKILMYIADNVVVQWPILKSKLKRADYLGQLM